MLWTHKEKSLKFQTETSRTATKKKCSKSGGVKNESGDLLKEQFESTLCFFGAGGHVEISGILNFCPFGVKQMLLETSITSEISISFSFEESCELLVKQQDFELTVADVAVKFVFFFWVVCFCFLKCVFLALVLLLVVILVVFVVDVDVVVGIFVLEVLLLLFVVVLPEGAIFFVTKKEKMATNQC